MADVWDKLVADCQACVKTKVLSGTAIITVRLLIKEGELSAWAPPAAQKWQTEERTWMDRRLKGGG